MRKRMLWILMCGMALSGADSTAVYAQAPTQQAQQREAMKRFLAAVAIAKNNLAATYYMQGQPDSAGVQLRDVLIISPDFASAHLTLGLIYYEQGDYLAALKAFKMAAPGDSVAQSRMNRAVPDTLYTWARRQFAQIVRGKPNLAAAHTALGLVYHEGGFQSDAERHYQAAIASDSSYANAYHNLGKLYADAQLFEDAIHVFEYATRFDQELPTMYLNLGLAYMGKDRADDAIRAWQKVIDLEPKNAQAYMNIGIVYQAQALNDSAEVFWKRSIAANAEFLAPRVALARLYVDQQRYEEAVSTYRRIIDLGIKDPRIYSELALSYEVLEQFNEALAYYQLALNLDPDNSDIKTSLTIVKQKQKQQEMDRQANKIRVRQIVVEMEQEAQEILTALRNGSDFVEMARTRSIDPSAARGGDLGYFGPGEMIPALETAAMALKINEISRIVQTPLGYHIIKRTE